MTYSVVICGDRNWTNKEIIKEFIRVWLPKHTVIIQGGCRGADKLARDAAVELGYNFITVNAEWNKYGKSAGPIRNQKMIDMKPHWVIAFHENIESSKGTKHMVGLAEKHHISYSVVGNGGILKHIYFDWKGVRYDEIS